MIDLLTLERQAREAGYQVIAGCDEVGMGAVAGGLAAGAVILPEQIELLGLRDSKTLSAAQREQAAQLIRAHALATSVAYVEPDELNAMGVSNAWRSAISRALAGLGTQVDFLLMDGVRHPGLRIPLQTVVKGDSKSLSVMSAGILAKVERDRILDQLDILFPGYGFSVHKGYLTAEHQAAIDQLGPCPVHRIEWAPFRKQLELF